MPECGLSVLGASDNFCGLHANYSELVHWRVEVADWRDDRMAPRQRIDLEKNCEHALGLGQEKANQTKPNKPECGWDGAPARSIRAVAQPRNSRWCLPLPPSPQLQ